MGKKWSGFTCANKSANCAQVEVMQTPTGLVNYTFLTPSVEIKKAIFMGVPTVAIRDRFSNAAAVQIRWPPAFEGSLAGRQTPRGPQTGFEEVGGLVS